MLNPAARLRTIGCLAAFVCTPGVSRHLSLRLIFRRSYICVKPEEWPAGFILPAGL